MRGGDGWRPVRQPAFATSPGTSSTPWGPWREVPLGRWKVIELLESYERWDRLQAQAEGRDPVDFGFLWTDLDLPRPE